MKTLKPKTFQTETPTRQNITSEIALADIRYGFGSSGFYRQLIYNPDELIGRYGVKIYSKMRNDEQVKAALTTKKLAAIAAGWEILIEDKERTEDKTLDEQKRFIEFNLAEMEGTPEAFLFDVLSALDFGWSLTEPCYRHIDYGEFKGMIGWRALKVRRPEQIEFETDQFGNLTEYGILQGNRRLPANRFAIYSYQKEFGSLYGTSDLRAAYRAWFCKDSLLKYMAMALERYGMPISVATAKQTLTDPQKTELLTALKNIQARTGIVLPEYIELKFEQPSPRTAEAFVPAMGMLDRWIAVAILMPQLLGMSSAQQSTGSLARSQTEFDTFLWIIEQLRKDLQEFINDRIVKVLIDLNYEVEDGVYPRFKFKELTHERKMEIMRSYNECLNAGAVTKTRQDEEFLRSLGDFPKLSMDIESSGTREQKIADYERRQRNYMRAVFWPRMEKTA